MDPTQKEEECSASESTKCCADCKTTKTPLWRIGPLGPRSLCNACGIKYSKKKHSKRPEKKIAKLVSSSSSSTTTNSKDEIGNEKDGGKLITKELKVRLMMLGKEVVILQRQRSSKPRIHRKKKLSEVEQAALLLMALSCGGSSVFA